MNVIRCDERFYSRVGKFAADRTAVTAETGASDPKAESEFDIQMFCQHQGIACTQPQSERIPFR